MPSPVRDAGPAILLLDNGSLEPAAVLSLREIASRLAAAVGCPVEPVSLLHSSAIPAGRLRGIGAEILETLLDRRAQGGMQRFVLVPLFFGPSRALTDYLPERVRLLKARHAGLRVQLAPPVANADDAVDLRLAGIIEDRVRSELATTAEPPAVILVDHGSPAPAVARVRDHLAAQLRDRLGPVVRGVLAASMERRPDPAYAFNEPLLERAWVRPGFTAGDVIVAPLFFSPGRHAGPGGDIARICEEAERRYPGLRVHATELIGSHPGLIPILADRLREGLASEPL
ncbi:MAG TPA: CbiX/SirB N-terminal domain-containing protein [Opitutaceae bacterium]|nr:CbiX/SirB N-terminal domain-containing protein [Opitutaceae bacterium]